MAKSKAYSSILNALVTLRNVPVTVWFRGLSAGAHVPSPAPKRIVNVAPLDITGWDTAGSRPLWV